MARYEYKCKCGIEFIKLCDYTKKDKVTCGCGEKAERVFPTKMNFSLKGGGYYSKP